MRAVVLSNDRIIESLNEKFVNTWVLNTDMKRLREAKGIDGMQPLARTIISGWKRYSPVDCLVISPDLELMGRQPVNELLNAMPHIEAAYQRFLVESLEGKRPGLGSNRHVALNAQQTSMEILNIFRAPGHGNQEYTTVEIDTTPFEDGGTLTIDTWVGNGEMSGSFDLFAGDTELPTTGIPDNALASAWEIEPGMSGHIVHRFDRGQPFKLGVTGSWSSEQGLVNAFWAKISVEPNRKPEPRKASAARPRQSAEDTMNAFVEAFKNLNSETLRSLLTGDARETFESDFEDVPEDMRPQVRQMLSQMEVLSSEYVGDEFHFRLRMPMAQPPEISVKMRKVEGVWFIYDNE